MPSEMQDPSAFLTKFVNQTSMGEVIGDGDLVSTTVFRKRGANKMTLIGKLKNPAIKKSILSQRKMFRVDRPINGPLIYFVCDIV